MNDLALTQKLTVKCNGWLGIAALPSLQGGSAIGLSATGPLAEPQPVMNSNLRHCILVPQRLKFRTMHEARQIAANKSRDLFFHCGVYLRKHRKTR